MILLQQALTSTEKTAKTCRITPHRNKFDKAHKTKKEQQQGRQQTRAATGQS